MCVIGQGAFADCENLASFHYPKHWTNKVPEAYTDYDVYRNGDTFQGDKKLTHIDVPEGVTIIPDSTFSNSDYLKTVSLPSTLKTIGYDAFLNCEVLNIPALPDHLTTIEGSAFWGCKALESLYIGPSVKEIGNFAFQDCTSLTIETTAGSTIAEYAKENEIPCIIN